MRLKAEQVMGHRGVPSLAPENTLGGFEKAASLGVRWVELDVSLLGDGTPMVIHDGTIDRCSDQSGALSQLTLADIKGVNNAALYSDWPSEPVPTLKQVLALLDQHQMSVNIELKDHDQPIEPLVQATVDLLRSDFPNKERVVISSFNLDMLYACRAYASDVRLGLLYDDVSVDWLFHAQQLNAYSIHCNWRYLNQVTALAIKQAGYQLYCWTANEPEAVASLWHWGIDAVMSDCPQAFFEYHSVAK